MVTPGIQYILARQYPLGVICDLSQSIARMYMSENTRVEMTIDPVTRTSNDLLDFFFVSHSEDFGVHLIRSLSFQK